MLTPTEHKILREYKDYLARTHKQFRAETKSKAALADYIYAVNIEAAWLKRQYPQVLDKLVIDRAYRNLLEAYKRAAEYPVRLSWGSLASFVTNRRPSILWAVLQAKADGFTALPEPKKTNVLHSKIVLERAWCEGCQTQARVIDGRLECCNQPIGEKTW